MGRVLLAAALVFTGLVGASEAGQFLVVVRATSACIGGGVIALYLLRAPARHDLVDLLALAAVLAFLLTCITSSSPRLSFDAATSATAYLAAFYLARGVAATPRGHELAITTLGTMGAVVSITFLLVWGSAWLRWVSVPDAGLPPLNLALPATPYRHYYLVGTLAALLLPATLLLARRPLVWPLAVAGSVAGVLVVFMSGSRTVWLAAMAAIAVAAIAGGWLHMPRSRRALAAAIGVAAALTVALALFSTQLIARLGAGSTVEGRFEIWGASIDRWLQSPLVGHGPGTFATQLTLGGQEALVIHGHNAVIQALVESGLVGVAGMALLSAAVLVGAWRHSLRQPAPLAGLVLFVAACLTDNPSVFGFLVVPAIAWAALAAPRAEAPAHPRSAWLGRAILSLSVIVGLATVSSIGAAWFYDRAATAAERGDTSTTEDSLRAAVALDPSHALYRRSLGIWLAADGDAAEALHQLDRTIDLNPADLAAHRAAAVINAGRGRYETAVALAASAVELRPHAPLSLLTLAWVAQAAGDGEAAHDALVEALSYEPWLAATPAWTQFTGDSVARLLDEAYDAVTDRAVGGMRQEDVARSWLAGMVGAPADPASVGTLQAAASAAIDCDIATAHSLLASLPRATLVNADGLLVRMLVARVQGEPTDDLVTLSSLRWPILAFLVERDVTGGSPFTELADDVWTYGRRAVSVPDEGLVLPTSEAGLSAWLRDPGSASRRGAPDSGLSTCRPGGTSGGG